MPPTPPTLLELAEQDVQTNGFQDLSGNNTLDGYLSGQIRQFYVSQFNTTTALTLDPALNSTVIGIPNINNIADYYINYETMKSIFKFSSSDISLPGTDAAVLADLHFYVINGNISSIDSSGNGGMIDLGNSNVSTGYVVTANSGSRDKLVDGQQSIAVDFIQNMSNVIFGSAVFDSYFTNTHELLDNISTQLNNEYHVQVITNSLENISTTNSNGMSGSDNNGLYYLDGTTQTATTNVCGIIYNQMSSRFPERFQYSNGLISNATTDPQSLPFLPGDSIVFEVAMAPMNDILNRSVELLSKTYLLRFVLTDSTTLDKIPVWCSGLGCIYPSAP